MSVAIKKVQSLVQKACHAKKQNGKPRKGSVTQQRVHLGWLVV